MPMNQRNWWDGGMIYQIYPRSFFDSNNDGVGDLPGIEAKLDYIAELGVDAIWVSPFNKSPMADFGYDVSDYRDIDPLFGNLQDFDRLLKGVHDRGLKFLMDIVPCHTSDQHAWFEDSRQDKTNAKADWYVWEDPRADGTEPNNWLSFFGGRAWSWEPRRAQYYLRHFLREQPNLNYYNPEVIEAMGDVLAFWFDKGIDGFRVDAIQTICHDPALTDNAPLPLEGEPTNAWERMPFGKQKHFGTQFDMPQTLKVLEHFRAVADRYDGKLLMGEIGGDKHTPGYEISAKYTGEGNKLHCAYNFDLLTFDEITVADVKRVLPLMQSVMEPERTTFAQSNHDVPRMLSTWGRKALAEGKGDDFAVMSITLLGTLFGSSCLYQGQELGLQDGVVPFDRLVDPYSIEFYPDFPGRDGCRCPMPWSKDAPHGGFSAVEPWLPMSANQLDHAVDQQQGQADSVLERVKAVLNWRRSNAVIREGGFEMLESAADVVAYRRTLGDESVLCLFNFSGVSAEFDSHEIAAYSALIVS